MPPADRRFVCHSSPRNGCKGAVDSCPWGVGIKENAALVATIVAGTTASTVFSIASLLPIRFRRLFPRNIMDIIASIYGKPKVGAQFDPDKKSLTQVLSAIRSKSYTKDEAMLFWVGKMGDLNKKSDTYANELTLLKSELDIIKCLSNETPSSASSDVSVYLYVLARLSTVICKGKDLVVALHNCGDCDVLTDQAPSSSSSSSSGSVV